MHTRTAPASLAYACERIAGNVEALTAQAVGGDHDAARETIELLHAQLDMLSVELGRHPLP